MFRQFREVAKACGERGWRLEREDGRYYLSKFEEFMNNNEIRIYLDITPQGIDMGRIEKRCYMKKMTKVSHVKGEEATYYQEKAETLCRIFWDTCLHNQKVAYSR